MLTTASLISIIANPEKFHGRKVSFIGFYSDEIEGKSIYVHANDYHFGIRKNRLAVTCKPHSAGNTTKGHKKYIYVEGIVDANQRGWVSHYSGSIAITGMFIDWEKMNQGLGTCS